MFGVYGLDEAALTAACEQVANKIRQHKRDSELSQLYATLSEDHTVLTGLTWGWQDYDADTLLEADPDELNKDARFIFMALLQIVWVGFRRFYRTCA